MSQMQDGKWSMSSDDEINVKLESVANRGDGGEPGLEAEAPK